MNDASPHLLSVEDLSVSFGTGAREVKAVRNVSFTIDKGETVALVGESGSGKTVTALSVLKLLPYPKAHHPSGRIFFRGRELLTANEKTMMDVRGDDISMIFQEPMTSLNPLHTVEKQINEVLIVHRGLARGDKKGRGQDHEECRKRENRRVGQKQRHHVNRQVYKTRDGQRNQPTAEEPPGQHAAARLRPDRATDEIVVGHCDHAANKGIGQLNCGKSDPHQSRTAIAARQAARP